jgi:lipoyl(octanoyl) transferase
MHGFSLNANVDLSWYDRFIPCGISDAGVTTLSAELGRNVTVAEAADAVTPHLVELLEWQRYEPSPDVTATPVVSVPVIGLSAAAGVS